MLATLKPFVRRVSLDLVFPPDPGGLRLLAALRATLAGVLTFFLVMLLGAVVAVPVTDRIMGFAIALFIAATGTRRHTEPAPCHHRGCPVGRVCHHRARGRAA